MVEFGLIGRGISHSFSGEFFNSKFSREGIDARYEMFNLEDISELQDIIRSHPGLRGLNVTSPYKRDVIPYMDSLSSEAEKLQAVNVIKFMPDGKLRGFNSDCIGFGESLSRFSLKGLSALVLGTGGAASAVGLALQKAGVSFDVVSRSPKEGFIGYEEANLLLPSRQLVINATPLGMLPDVEACPPIDYDRLTPSHICYDLIYNPSVTLFMSKSARKGATVKNGLEMLIGQAVSSWNIWAGND